MRIGVVARGTHSLHLERGFDTLKRNLSLESRSNIKLWFRVFLWRIRHYNEPIIPRRFLLLLFLTLKNSISTIKLSSNHLLKVRGTHSLHLERGFDTLKRNLSLESRSNIKSWFMVCLWRIRCYDEPIIPRPFYYYCLKPNLYNQILF